MASINSPVKNQLTTHEGGQAYPITNLEVFKRSVLCTMLWENTFYEDGISVVERIKKLAFGMDPKLVKDVMFQAKFEQKIRHTPLFIASVLSQNGSLKKEDLFKLITRVDDITEFMAIYWKDGKTPVDHQVRKGLAMAFDKFDEYQLQKYNRDKTVKLRDVMKMVRPKPKNDEQAKLWGKLIHNELATPDTWETELSSGKDKKETFERLIIQEKLGDLAFIRNLRNMIQSNVSVDVIKHSFAIRQWKWILPFQFITAARYAPNFEPEIEQAMLNSISGMEKFNEKITLLVDVSGSMNDPVSSKSDVKRIDVAASLAIILRELSDDVLVYKFNDKPSIVPARKGFALRDAIGSATGGTNAHRSIYEVQKEDRTLIVITDEQTHDSQNFKFISKFTVILNVGTYENGIAYGKNQLHINGWSESVVGYLKEYLEKFAR